MPRTILERAIKSVGSTGSYGAGLARPDRTNARHKPKRRRRSGWRRPIARETAQSGSQLMALALGQRSLRLRSTPSRQPTEGCGGLVCAVYAPRRTIVATRVSHLPQTTGNNGIFPRWQEWQGSNLRPPPVLETVLLPIGDYNYSYREPASPADPRRFIKHKHAPDCKGEAVTARVPPPQFCIIATLGHGANRRLSRLNTRCFNPGVSAPERRAIPK